MTMSYACDAVVVGSGPNGLAAAITLARAGCSVLVCEANTTIGGGARSAELTLSGFVHDVCSAVHPLAAGSPFFKTLPLERFGLEWIQPDIPLAHPFDDGTAACLYRDVDLTAAELYGDLPGYVASEIPVQGTTGPRTFWWDRRALVSSFGGARLFCVRVSARACWARHRLANST